MIERLTTPEAVKAALPELVELLSDAVESGASVGFLLPIDRNEIEVYWRKVIAALDERVLLVLREGERIVGSVQLYLEPRANGAHRAEVQKLLVHQQARRKGYGRLLMQAVEGAAQQASRTLIVLDTRKGDSAEKLYLSLGYQITGVVPRYALSPNRERVDDCTFMYKLLTT
jgi:acetyltransferase